MRPTLIVAEPEPHEALSVRKLLLETAKFNVLTAHSTDEAIEVVQSFPNVSAIVAVDDNNIDCEIVTATAKERSAQLPVIALSARSGYRCVGADHHVSSHEPEQLLKIVRGLLGDPRAAETVEDSVVGRPQVRSYPS
jgi:DNA-binding response OmpR family regulator